MRISEKPPGFTTALPIQTKPRPNKTEDFFRKVCPLGGIQKKNRMSGLRSHSPPAPVGRKKKKKKKEAFFELKSHRKVKLRDVHNFLPQEVAALLLQHRVMRLKDFPQRVVRHVPSSAVSPGHERTSLLISDGASSVAENIFTPVWRCLLVLSLLCRLLFWVNRGSYFLPVYPNRLRVMRNWAALRDQRRVRHFWRLCAWKSSGANFAANLHFHSDQSHRYNIHKQPLLHFHMPRFLSGRILACGSRLYYSCLGGSGSGETASSGKFGHFHGCEAGNLKGAAPRPAVELGSALHRHRSQIT